MMDSTVDDDFNSNPFRSGASAGSDPFTNNNAAMQQPPQHQQQQPMYAQQQPPPPQQNYDMPPQGQMQQQQQQQPQYNYNQQQQPTMMSSGGGAMMQGTMDDPNAQSTPTSYWGMCMACVRLDTYMTYFDIDTIDVRDRMKAAVTHFHQPQYFRDQVVGADARSGGTNSSTSSGSISGSLKGPDLYGPFWITMTLIFFVAATANWSASLRYSTDVQEFEYDINHLLHAFSFLFTFVFGVPSAFWFATRCMSMNALSWAEWVCFYGYSMVPFLPASLLCIIPSNFVAWIVLFVASIASCLLVLRNASSPILAADPSGVQKAMPIIIAILACHFIFFVSMSITFYHHGKTSSVPDATDGGTSDGTDTGGGDGSN